MMLWSIVFVVAGAAVGSGASAGAGTGISRGSGLPSIAGNPTLSAELVANKRWESTLGMIKHLHLNTARADDSENMKGRCGAGHDNASCAPGYCCSSAGWCGNKKDYCFAPDCQIDFGPGCDGNQKPKGEDTSDVPRPKVGKVAYGGTGIYRCVNPGDIALTYDDGPFDFTDDLLDVFKKYDAVATFFINGNNKSKGKINDPKTSWPAVIKRMAKEGHHIASHTWSHQNFSQMTEEQARNQVIWNEIALNDILGYFPTYLRPPFSICPEKCQTMLADLGYHVVYFNLDTEGYLHANSGEEIQKSKDIWDKAVDGSDPCNTTYLAIEHDLQEQVVYNLTEYMLKSLLEHGYRPVTVGECLGDPPENWYRSGKGEVPEYTYTPLTPTGSSSCVSRPVRTTEVGTTTSEISSEIETTSTVSGVTVTTSIGINEPTTAQDDESPEGGSNPSGAGSRLFPSVVLFAMSIFITIYRS